jgi:hypothetical protein
VGERDHEKAGGEQHDQTDTKHVQGEGIRKANQSAAALRIGHGTVPLAEQQQLTQLWQRFRDENAEHRLAYLTGTLSFLNVARGWVGNLAATGERIKHAVMTAAGRPDPDPKLWGCADVAPRLLDYMRAHYHGHAYRFEVLTSRNFAGLQHNQVVALGIDGSRRIFDPWAGGEVAYDDNPDHTFVPLGQVLELVVQQEVEGTAPVATRPFAATSFCGSTPRSTTTSTCCRNEHSGTAVNMPCLLTDEAAVPRLI